MALSKIQGAQIETPVDISAVNLTGVTTAARLVGTAVSVTSGGLVAGIATINNINATHLNITGITTVAAGSTSAPSITPTGDNNTGVFFPSADTIAFSEGGVETFRVDSNSNLLVGVKTATGTTSQPLQVTGGGYFSGFVGIGTTNPIADLHVQSSSFPTISIRNASNASGFPVFQLVNNIPSQVSYQIENGRDSGCLQIRDNTAVATRVTLNSSGNIGIATTNPSAPLHVFTSKVTGLSVNANYDKLIVENGTSGQGVTLQLVSNATNGVSEIGFTDSTRNAGLISYQHSTDAMVFQTATTEKVRIGDNGVVCIGTTTSNNNTRLLQKLTITGAAVGIPGMSITGYTGTGQNNRPIFDFNRSISTTDQTLTAVRNNDALGSVIFRGSDGSVFQDAALISGEIDGNVGLTSTPGRISFWTVPSGSSSVVERMRLTSAGYLRLNQLGIQFNGDTADANSLDDYEEGTFTPTITYGSGTVGSYTGQTGLYTKIGRLVHCMIDIAWTLGTGSGNVLVSGLPFSVFTLTNHNPSSSTGYSSGFTTLPIMGHGNSNQTIINLYNAATQITAANLSASNRIIISITYSTN